MLKNVKNILKRFNYFSLKKRLFVILKSPVYFKRYLREEKDFLIMATGPMLDKYRTEIRKFIYNKGSNLKTMACNFNDLCIPDYHIITNRARFCTYARTVPEKSVLLLSVYIAEYIIRHFIGSRYYEDVMYKSIYFSDKGSLKIDRRGVIYLKAGTLATVACGVALVMGAKNIYFAGLDGFSMYKDRPDDIHFFNDSDSIPFDRRLMQEKATYEILDDAAEMLRGHGGKIKILTPTVYEKYYDGSILR